MRRNVLCALVIGQMYNVAAVYECSRVAMAIVFCDMVSECVQVSFLAFFDATDYATTYST